VHRPHTDHGSPPSRDPMIAAQLADIDAGPVRAQSDRPRATQTADATTGR